MAPADHWRQKYSEVNRRIHRSERGVKEDPDVGHGVNEQALGASTIDSQVSSK